MMVADDFALLLLCARANHDIHSGPFRENKIDDMMMASSSLTANHTEAAPGGSHLLLYQRPPPLYILRVHTPARILCLSRSYYLN